ncbi:orotidine 5'-phosphate decarboxylase / HUMPS family protein [Pediococcus acidilactici]|uniref:orotidine 5'-phosphate decarboxylase / HUMPS family protein n=1 Tax=Pediococcus acidilactici TaxID=1254 RepID=UPI003A95820C
MKLQVAIDRVSLKEALELARKLDPIVDIIELGTSIVKDYGLVHLKEQVLDFNHAQLLLDLKTNDEGIYEFKQGYKAGADILTVMATSSSSTVRQVYNVAMESNKQVLIDLMEADNQTIGSIINLQNAIFGVHHSKDAGSGFDAVKTVEEFHERFPQVEHIAVAGGIDLEQARKLAKQGIAETIIVGSKIVGASDVIATAKEFMEVIK